MSTLYIFGDSFSTNYRELKLPDDNPIPKYFNREVENGYKGVFQDYNIILKIIFLILKSLILLFLAVLILQYLKTFVNIHVNLKKGIMFLFNFQLLKDLDYIIKMEIHQLKFCQIIYMKKLTRLQILI